MTPLQRSPNKHFVVSSAANRTTNIEELHVG
jgi:hypothetical protein